MMVKGTNNSSSFQTSILYANTGLNNNYGKFLWKMKG
jgi:hypothetical protein